MSTNKQPLCLFCLSSEGPFHSEEHILPRGLGNTMKVLSPGVVCDQCNNGTLSELDTHLSNFEPIKGVRIIYAVPNRDGVVPAGKFNNLDIVYTGNNHIDITMKSRKSGHLKLRDDGFTYTTVGRKITNSYMKKLARALYKMGLEMIYSDLGPKAAYSKRYDEVRNIVLGRKDFSGVLAIVRHPNLEQISRARHHIRKIDKREVSFFDFYYYGVQILYGMEVRDLGDLSHLPPDVFNIIEIHEGK